MLKTKRTKINCIVGFYNSSLLYQLNLLTIFWQTFFAVMQYVADKSRGRNISFQTR